MLDQHLRESFTIPPMMIFLKGELHTYSSATALIHMWLDFRLSVETSVAPPPVILDTPSGTGEGGEEGEGEDDDYIVGNSTSLAPPTNEQTTILPTSDTIPDQPEGESTNVSCLPLQASDYPTTRSTDKDNSGYKGTAGRGRRERRGRGRGRDPRDHHTSSAQKRDGGSQERGKPLSYIPYKQFQRNFHTIFIHRWKS